MGYVTKWIWINSDPELGSNYKMNGLMSTLKFGHVQNCIWFTILRLTCPVIQCSDTPCIFLQNIGVQYSTHSKENCDIHIIEFEFRIEHVDMVKYIDKNKIGFSVVSKHY